MNTPVYNTNHIQFAIVGDTFHTPVKGEFEFIRDYLILVNADGDIDATFTADHPWYPTMLTQLTEQGKLQTLRQGQYLLPGLVDLHCHAHSGLKRGKDWIYPSMIGCKTIRFH